MSSKNFYILLDMPGDTILGMGSFTESELHSKVAELLALNKQGVMVYDVETDAARRAVVCYESLSNERLSRKMLIEALLLRNPALSPAVIKVLTASQEAESADAGSTKVIPFLESRSGEHEKTR